MEKAEKTKLHVSRELVKHMQTLFSSMMLGNVKY